MVLEKINMDEINEEMSVIISAPVGIINLKTRVVRIDEASVSC